MTFRGLPVCPSARLPEAQRKPAFAGVLQAVSDG